MKTQPYLYKKCKNIFVLISTYYELTFVVTNNFFRIVFFPPKNVSLGMEWLLNHPVHG